MHIHILGICGTFMGSLAVLAKSLGHRVTGCDANVYPPMSTQLEAQGIELYQGYDVGSLDERPDLVIVGNAMSRGKPVVEAMLDNGIPYMSGPQWLGQALLQQRHVLAISGTHGKTTTASMLAWVLQDQGLEPGYLIGGVPQNFDVSASVGKGRYFVIEADEYDTAFFDKRSKFVHYHPNTLVINNLEFDHADIFDNLSDIQRQFHHVVRVVPSSGRIIAQADEPAIEETLAKGCWSPIQSFGEAGLWQAHCLVEDGSQFDVLLGDEVVGRVDWSCIGEHNVNNALAVIAAADHIGIKPVDAAASLSKFSGVKRRMELKAVVGQRAIYDDFAHHPTAIATTLSGLRKRVGDEPIFAVLEPRSNTMKMGVHDQSLASSVSIADHVAWLLPEGSALDTVLPSSQARFTSVDRLVEHICAIAPANAHILFMSNGGFGGIHQLTIDALSQKTKA